MRWVVFSFLVVFTGYGHAQIYDCFLFFNELEILDIRLHEMYEHVDKFVLVESVETFRGNLKPLYYQENQERYKKFSDKIIHIVLKERVDTIDPWERETFQRNQIIRGLNSCQPEDVVIISDVDEIVKGSVMPQIVQLLLQDRQDAVICEQPMYRLYLNVRDFCLWAGTCATTFQHLSTISPELLRRKRYVHNEKGEIKFCYPFIVNGGWHFTSMGGLELAIKKMESYSHQECDLAQNKTERAIFGMQGILPANS